MMLWMLEGEGNSSSLKERYMAKNGLTQGEWDELARPFMETLVQDAIPLPDPQAEVTMRDIERRDGREYVYLRIPMAGRPNGTKSTVTPTFGGSYPKKMLLHEAACIRDIIRPFAIAMREHVRVLGK